MSFSMDVKTDVVYLLFEEKKKTEKLHSDGELRQSDILPDPQRARRPGHLGLFLSVVRCVSLLKNGRSATNKRPLITGMKSIKTFSQV